MYRKSCDRADETACDTSPDLQAHDNRQQLQIVQANWIYLHVSVCMQEAASGIILL
jgi:hypothetical protein